MAFLSDIVYGHSCFVHKKRTAVIAVLLVVWFFVVLRIIAL